jgi:hypothetical protein
MKKLFLLLAVVILVSGCAAGRPWYAGGNWDPYKPTDLEMAFGNAYYASIKNQTLNPDASKNLFPVLGIDGISAEEILKSLHKSYQKQQPEPTYIFNVGQGAGVR